jgi:L-asparagine transporter-like permease
MWYALALLVHILGAIALFVAVSLIVVAFVRMRQASTLEQVRERAVVANVAGKSMIFLALIIIFAVLSIMGATLNGRTIERVVALTRAAEPGPVPDKVRTQLLSPSLWLAEVIRLALLLGILCLMTTKPDMLFSWLILAVMLLLGIILGVSVQRSPKQISRKEPLL